MKTLRDMGAFVFPTHTIGRGFPDLAVYDKRTGLWHLPEVKNGSVLGWKLTPAQRTFRIESGATIPILDSTETAVMWWNGLIR